MPFASMGESWSRKLTHWRRRPRSAQSSAVLPGSLLPLASGMHRCQQLSELLVVTPLRVHDAGSESTRRWREERARRSAWPPAPEQPRATAEEEVAPSRTSSFIASRSAPYVFDASPATDAPDGGRTMRPYHMRRSLSAAGTGCDATERECGVARGTKAGAPPAAATSFGLTMFSVPWPSMKTSASESKAARTTSPPGRVRWKREASSASTARWEAAETERAGVKAMKRPMSVCIARVEPSSFSSSLAAAVAAGAPVEYEWMCSRCSPLSTTSLRVSKEKPSGVARRGFSTRRSAARRAPKRRTAPSIPSRNGSEAAANSRHAAESLPGLLKGCAPPGPGIVCVAMVRRVVASSNVWVWDQVPHAAAPSSTALRPLA